MANLFVYVFAFIVVQQSLSSVAHAKFHHGFGMNSCCNVEPTPAGTEHSEKVKKNWADCEQELGDPEGGKHKGRFACMAECMAQKFSILNEDKTINEAAFKDHIVNDMANQDYLKAIADATATKCIEASKQPDDGEHPSKCSKASMKASRCVMKEFLKACPADLQDKSEPCQKMREGQKDEP